MQQTKHELKQAVDFARLKTVANRYLMVSAGINVIALVILVIDALKHSVAIGAFALAGVAIFGQLAYTVWKIRNGRLS